MFYEIIFTMEKEYRLAGSSYLIYTRSQKWKRSTCWSICHWFGNLICCCCEKLCEVDLSLCTIWTSCQINYMQWNAVICALMLGTCRLKYGFMITTLIWVLEFGFVQFDAIWNPLSRTATVKKISDLRQESSKLSSICIFSWSYAAFQNLF